jgi:hypothetical protein
MDQSYHWKPFQDAAGSAAALHPPTCPQRLIAQYLPCTILSQATAAARTDAKEDSFVTMSLPWTARRCLNRESGLLARKM